MYKNEKKETRCAKEEENLGQRREMTEKNDQIRHFPSSFLRGQRSRNQQELKKTKKKPL